MLQPQNPREGDIWWNPVTDKTYEYVDGEWIELPKRKVYCVKVSFMNSGSISTPVTAKDNFSALSKALKRWHSNEEKEIIGVKITYIQPDDNE